MAKPIKLKMEKPIRNDNAIANLKEMQKINPQLTFERAYDNVLTLDSARLRDVHHDGEGGWDRPSRESLRQSMGTEVEAGVAKPMRNDW